MLFDDHLLFIEYYIISISKYKLRFIEYVLQFTVNAIKAI